MAQWNAIYKAANSLEAHMLKGALEVSGIAVQLQGEALAGAVGELPVSAIEVTVLVQAQHLVPAKQILLAYQQPYTHSWHCRHCGEHNDGSFEVCWQCGQEAPQFTD
ncbi:putative signal transducing protein [Oceanisphaera avium]|uniref:RanBP2-type domain-containing protein n=1 Tax=Oceanisphaera avium TaxID=1903694 RepID=A0A1Y0CZ13_9GAMM|nr:DUF2007 domain-containing protein [Oceanisphaera avium]ART80571.1 hypothetical protein CBP12_10830 [Oceanisphaera avium]